MSIKKNVIANYVGQIYVSLIGIMVLPLYLDYLGAEAYGLIGFFVVLQSWLQLLDLGLTPTLSRQVAFVRGEGTDFIQLKRQLRSIELLFWIMSFLIAVSIYGLRDWIANDWLNVVQLNIDDVVYSMSLMGIIIGLRLITSLYKSGINGLEKQVWLNTITALFASIRFLGALAIMYWISNSYVLFFEFQLAISIIELFVFTVKLHGSLPATEKVRVRFYFKEVKAILPFALSIGYTTGIWIFISQIDKLVLSNVLPLTEYGYFAIIAVISTGLIQLSAPIGKALMPRMTFLLAVGKKKEMLTLYRNATQLMAVIMLPLACFIAIYAKEILLVWTGDEMAAEWGAPVLFWYALGGGIVSLVSFQYYLQYAHGKLKLFVLLNTITALFYVPIVIYVAFKYGAIGTGLVWFLLHLIGFIFVTYIVHRRFAPKIHFLWLSKDIFPILVATVLGAYCMFAMDITYQAYGRLEGLVYLVLTGMGMLIFSSFGSSVVRRAGINYLLFRSMRNHD